MKLQPNIEYLFHLVVGTAVLIVQFGLAGLVCRSVGDLMAIEIFDIK